MSIFEFLFFNDDVECTEYGDDDIHEIKLGVVELTVSLLIVYDSKDEEWDV